MPYALGAMSIYGQDTRMLDIIYPPPSYPPSNPVSTPLSECNDPSIPTSKCHFFTLPLELRQQIYSYILPYTSFITSIGTGGIVWYRGNTTILAASRLLHEECAAQLYGSSVFSLCVTWDCTIFDFRWVHPLGLLPKRRMPFPEGFSNRSLKLMRRFFVRINHLDPYTGEQPCVFLSFSGCQPNARLLVNIVHELFSSPSPPSCVQYFNFHLLSAFPSIIKSTFIRRDHKASNLYPISYSLKCPL